MPKKDQTNLIATRNCYPNTIRGVPATCGQANNVRLSLDFYIDIQTILKETMRKPARGSLNRQGLSDVYTQ